MLFRPEDEVLVPCIITPYLLLCKKIYNILYSFKEYVGYFPTAYMCNNIMNEKPKST